MIPYIPHPAQVTRSERLLEFVEKKRKEDADRQRARGEARLMQGVEDAALEVEASYTKMQELQDRMLGVQRPAPTMGDSAARALAFLRGETGTVERVIGAKQDRIMQEERGKIGLDLQREGERYGMASSKHDDAKKYLEQFVLRSQDQEAKYSDAMFNRAQDRFLKAQDLEKSKFAEKTDLEIAQINADREINQEKIKQETSLRVAEIRAATEAGKLDARASEKELDRAHAKELKYWQAEIDAAKTPAEKTNAEYGQVQALIRAAQSKLVGAESQLKYMQAAEFPEEEIAKQSAKVAELLGQVNSLQLSAKGVPKTVPNPEHGRRVKMAEQMSKWLGTKYKFGGTGKEGVDCSAMVQSVFKAGGVSLPRTCREQVKMGVKVEWKDMQPGDLIFLKGTQKALPKDVASHVGIYLGDGKVQHASYSRGVIVDNLSKFWQDKFHSVRRVTQ